MWRIITWLIGLIFKVKGNPIATGIVQAVGVMMACLPPGSVASAFELVKLAAADDTLDSTEKFRYVRMQLAQDYPDIETNMLNTLINAALEAIRKGFV
jgi:hypothetical protein